eukprot:TRINITY_DN4186_c1_g1_i3.p1 TRINITY_DN4186_c1_g1~~TRINITY_DN4186_c1_g1_i3.p1  ORF type:complete len:137 (+),score=12.74 TRINITY_DN4186_c1_g1_i3:75-485(+)
MERPSPRSELGFVCVCVLLLASTFLYGCGRPDDGSVCNDSKPTHGGGERDDIHKGAKQSESDVPPHKVGDGNGNVNSALNGSSEHAKVKLHSPHLKNVSACVNWNFQCQGDQFFCSEQRRMCQDMRLIISTRNEPR